MYGAPQPKSGGQRDDARQDCARRQSRPGIACRGFRGNVDGFPLSSRAGRAALRFVAACRSPTPSQWSVLARTPLRTRRNVNLTLQVGCRRIFIYGGVRAGRRTAPGSTGANDFATTQTGWSVEHRCPEVTITESTEGGAPEGASRSKCVRAHRYVSRVRSTPEHWRRAADGGTTRTR